jgi:MFS family permease
MQSRARLVKSRARVIAGTEDRSRGAPPAAAPRERVARYHLLVVAIAAAGWLFDCMDQRLFTLSRDAALLELCGGDKAAATAWGGWATAAMMVGWATGGIVFGVFSDRRGRVRTMVLTLLVYSLCTGLSGFAQSVGAFFAWRFLTGLGIGGMFGAATTLVAESVPAHFRPLALGLVQTLSTCGNMLGSLLSTRIQPGAPALLYGLAGWRVLFFVGVLPALLALPMLALLREPERWRAARAAGPQAGGSLALLWQHPTWRRHLLAGIGLGLAGMAGLWGIGFFSPELVKAALHGEPQDVIDRVRGYATALQDLGSLLGVLAFTAATAVIGRRPAFLGSCVLALVTTVFTFQCLHTRTDAYWMLPLLGFAQFTLFGAYAIWFPELFPTRLRGAGVGCCYNTVRYLAAAFPPLLTSLQAWLAGFSDEPIRLAATILSPIYLLGIVALWWAPETKGRALPEDEPAPA